MLDHLEGHLLYFLFAAKFQIVYLFLFSYSNEKYACGVIWDKQNRVISDGWTHTTQQ